MIPNNKILLELQSNAPRAKCNQLRQMQRKRERKREQEREQEREQGREQEHHI